MHAINVIGTFIVDVIMWILRLAGWMSIHLPEMVIASLILVAVIAASCFFMLQAGVVMLRRCKSPRQL